MALGMMMMTMTKKTDLPGEMVLAVLKWLPCLDRARTAMAVCRQWHDAVEFMMQSEREPYRMCCWGDRMMRGLTQGWNESDRWTGHFKAWLCERHATSGGAVGRSRSGRAMRAPRDDSDRGADGRCQRLNARQWCLTMACAYGHDVCAEALARAMRRVPDDWRIGAAAAMADNVRCLQLVHGLDHAINVRAWNYAAMMRRLGSLRWMVEHGFSNDVVLADEVAASGAIACARYLMHHGRLEFDAMACMEAAAKGHRAWLAYAYVTGHRFEPYLLRAAMCNRRTNCVRYLFAGPCPLGSWVCAATAKPGCLAYLRYVRNNGYTLEEMACISTAVSDHLGCLAFVRASGCNWPGNLALVAAQAGSLGCLRHVHRNGGLHDDLSALNNNGGVCADTVLNRAVLAPRMRCLVYAHNHGCRWDRLTVRYAVKRDSADVLCYVHRHGCPLDATTGPFAALTNRLGCLRYANANSTFACEAALTYNAVIGERLRCLRYVHSHGTCERPSSPILSSSIRPLSAFDRYAHFHGYMKHLLVVGYFLAIPSSPSATLP